MTYQDNNLLDRQQAIEMVARDTFFSALHQSTWNTFFNRLKRKPNSLQSFEDTYQECQLLQQHELGTYPVPIEHITGSVGRTKDFDRHFFPRNTRNVNRWVRIAIAFQKGIGLPAVELYKIGEQYFVIDGNHRISVAAAYGQTFIDARVTEIILA